MAYTIAVATSPTGHSGTLFGVDPSMFSLHFDARKDGWDIADDPMLVELVTSLHVTRTTAAPVMVPMSPGRIDAASSEDEGPDRCLHLGTTVGRRMWMGRYRVVLGMARYALCSLSSEPSFSYASPRIPRLLMIAISAPSATLV
jgi:hypothetical protein